MDEDDEVEEPYTAVPSWGFPEEDEDEDDIISRFGMDPLGTRDEWQTGALLTVPSSDNALRTTEARKFVDALMMLEHDLKDGVLPADTKRAMTAVRYARHFLKVYQDMAPIPTALIPLAYRRMFGQGASIKDTLLIPEGYTAKDMILDDATRMMEKNFGELVEVAAKELVNGLMTVGLWKYERGQAYFSVNDVEGHCTVWMRPEEWERIES